MNVRSFISKVELIINYYYYNKSFAGRHTLKKRLRETWKWSVFCFELRETGIIYMYTEKYWSQFESFQLVMLNLRAFLVNHG